MAIVVSSLAPAATQWQNTVVYELAGDADSVTEEDVNALRALYGRTKPSLVFSCLGNENAKTFDELTNLYWF